MAEGKALKSLEVQNRVDENPVNIEIRELLYFCEIAAGAEPEKYGGFDRNLPGSKTAMSKWLEACRRYWPPEAERLHMLAKQQGRLDDEHERKFDEVENRINDAAYDGCISLIGIADHGTGQREPIHPMEFSPASWGKRLTFASAENRIGSWTNVHVERDGFEKWLGKPARDAQLSQRHTQRSDPKSPAKPSPRAKKSLAIHEAVTALWPGVMPEMMVQTRNREIIEHIKKRQHAKDLVPSDKHIGRYFSKYRKNFDI